jgi:hypothetical protein
MMSETNALLNGLEDKRLHIMNRIRLILLGSLALAALIVASNLLGLSGPLAPLIGVPVVVLAAYGARKYYIRSLVRHAKGTLVPAIIREFDSSLTYNADQGLSESDFNAPQLFKRPDRYHALDLVTGRYGKTALRFSLVHAEERRERVTRDVRGRKRTEVYYVSIFQGILLVADFNKNLRARTVVTPKIWNPLNFAHRLTLEDPAFNERFSAKSSDSIEGRYVLTPSMMDRLVKLRDRFDFRVAFLSNTIYLTAIAPLTLLEPNVKTNFLNGDQVEQMRAALKSILGIIDELDLNTRIWTRA